jgi:DNA primase
MLNKLIDNYGKEGTECSKVLGSEGRVNQLASHWKAANLYELIAAHELLEYIQKRSFNKEEIEAFKKGLAAIPSFLSQCHLEREARISLEAEKTSQS